MNRATEDLISYVTDSTNLAAYLHALGSQMAGVQDAANGRGKEFIFNLTQTQYDAIPHFYDGTGMVSALAYSNSRKIMLGMVKD